MMKEDTTELNFRETLKELKNKINSYEEHYIEVMEQWSNFMNNGDDDEIIRLLISIKNILDSNIKLSTQRDLRQYE